MRVGSGVRDLPAARSDFWWARFARHCADFLPGPARLASLPSLQRLRRPFARLVEADRQPRAGPELSPGLVAASRVPLELSRLVAVGGIPVLRAVSVAGGRSDPPGPRRLLFLALGFVVAMAFVRDALLSTYAAAPDASHTLRDLLSGPVAAAIHPRHRARPPVPLWSETSARTYKAIALAGLVAVIVAFGWQSDLPHWLAWARTETGTVGILFGRSSSARPGWPGRSGCWPRRRWCSWAMPATRCTSCTSPSAYGGNGCRPRRWDCRCRRCSISR